MNDGTPVAGTLGPWKLDDDIEEFHAVTLCEFHAVTLCARSVAVHYIFWGPAQVLF